MFVFAKKEKTMHIYDKEFTQTELPMTKQEIRAISIAKLMLNLNSILIDVGAGTGTIDRKSTRLNSSHANISYAVFCLKKKIITLITLRLGVSTTHIVTY